MASDRITTEEVYAKWAEMAPLIDAVHQRTNEPGEFPVSEVSNLHDDDLATAPYHLSHAVRQCLAAGVDHLRAVKTLIVDAGVAHLAAPSTLARGALETLSAAFWMLDPVRRDDRVERCVNWHVKNAKDRDTALRGAGITPPKSLDDILERVRQPAIARGIASKRLMGYQSTDTVLYTDANRVNNGPSVTFMWRLASGYAHGRPWAYLGASSRDDTATDLPGIFNVRMTASDTTTLAGPLTAMFLLEDLLKLYERRAGVGLIL